MSGSSFSDKDHGFDAMLGRMDRASFGAKLMVGILEEEGAQEHGDSGLTIAEIGEFHEFGLGVPRRSFIADWADETEEEHKAQIRKVAEAVVKGKVESWEQGLERLGVLYVAEVQKRISDGGVVPGLDPDGPTAKRKGSTVALIDTGALRSAITYKISK